MVPALLACFDFCEVGTPSRAWLFPEQGSSSLGFWDNSRFKSCAERVHRIYEMEAVHDAHSETAVGKAS